jgi:hypothetical protein
MVGVPTRLLNHAPHWPQMQITNQTKKLRIQNEYITFMLSIS